MTIINPNSIAGITSVTAEAGVMNFYKSDGTLAGLQLNGVNFNTTSGISTFNNVYVGGTITYEDVKNVDSVGIITARGVIDAQGYINLAQKIIHTGDADTSIEFPSNNTIKFETAGSERFRITSDGQIGVNKSSPKAWNTSYTSLQIHDAGYIVGSTDDSFVAIGANNYLDTGGNYDYTNSDFASQLYQVNGELIFRNAASGTADNAITWAERLKIAQDGTTTATGTSDGVLQLDTSDSRGAFIRFGQGGSYHNMVGCADGLTSGDKEDLGIRAADNIIFAAGGSTERLRIDSSGRLLVGTTTNSISSSQIAEFNGMTYFTNNSSSTGTIYIRNQYSNTGLAQHIIFTDGSGNRAGFGLNNSDQLEIHGHQGILFKSGGTVGGGSEKLRIDSSGRVLIGTTTEGHSNGDDLTLNNSGNCGLTLRSGTSSNGNIFFSDATSGGAEYQGMIWYAHGDDSMRFATSQTTRLVIKSTGLVNILGDSGNDGFYLSNAYGQAGIFGGIYYDGSSWVRAATGTRKGAGMYVNTAGHIAFLKAPEASGTSATVTESARITSAGNLLIGKTADSGKPLEVYQAGDAAIRIQNNASGTASNDGILLEIGGSTKDALIWNYESANMRFGTAGTERLRIGSDGTVTVKSEDLVFETTGKGIEFPNSVSIKQNVSNLYANLASGNNNVEFQSNGTSFVKFRGSTKDLELWGGNLMISTAGKGIDFSAQTVGSASGVSVSSEVLDHYEEGTWTPDFRGYHHSNGAWQSWVMSTSGTRTGYYVRIGQVVSCWAKFEGFQAGSGMSYVSVMGLPYISNVASMGFGSSGFADCFDQTNGNPTGTVSAGGFYNMLAVSPNQSNNMILNTSSNRTFFCGFTYRTTG